MACTAARVFIVLTCVNFLVETSRRSNDDEVVASQREALLAWKDKFDDEAYLEDASLYAAMGPAAAWASTDSQTVLHGRPAVSKFWKSIMEKGSSKTFRAFEDSGPFQPKILVVDDDEVIVSGDFAFDGVKGRILSQTWVGKNLGFRRRSGAGPTWQMKSYMLSVDSVSAALAKVEKKIVKEEADVVEKTQELINGTLSTSEAKQLEHEIEDVKKAKKEDLEDASGKSGTYLLIPGCLVVCGGITAVFAVQHHKSKYSVSSVSGPEYMLG